MSLELLNLDLSFMFYVGDGNFYFYAGPGWASVTMDLKGLGPDGQFVVDEEESNFSLHGGIGYNWDFGENAYLRWDGRLRYIDADVYSGETDFETTLAIGWNFGG